MVGTSSRDSRGSGGTALPTPSPPRGGVSEAGPLRIRLEPAGARALVALARRDLAKGPTATSREESAALVAAVVTLEAALDGMTVGPLADTPPERAPPRSAGAPRDVRPSEIGAEAGADVGTEMGAEVGNLVREGERVALLVDAPNVDLACRAAGWAMDWGRARDLLVGEGRLTAAHYHVVDFGDAGMRAYADAVARTGFSVRRKAVRAEAARDDKGRWRASVAVDLALDAVAAADRFDVALLLSGDSNLEPLVRFLQGRGKRVHVASARAALSREIALAADKPIILLDELRRSLEREVA